MGVNITVSCSGGCFTGFTGNPPSQSGRRSKVRRPLGRPGGRSPDGAAGGTDPWTAPVLAPAGLLPTPHARRDHGSVLKGAGGVGLTTASLVVRGSECPLQSPFTKVNLPLVAPEFGRVCSTRCGRRASGLSK